MNEKPTMIMPLEISQRELLPKVHLALEAAKRNYRVYICDFLAARALFPVAKKPVTFFHKSTWAKQVDRIRAHGHKFVFLDEEMGLAIPPDELRASCARRWAGVTSDRYDALFTIGPLHADFGRQVVPDKDVPVYDTGWPRFDLWRSDIAPRISGSDSPHHRKYHLFASSFGPKVPADLVAHFRSKAQPGQQSHQEHSDREQSFYLCLPVLKEFADHLEKEGTDLIIRPHNSESSDDWNKIFSGFSNVYIRTGGDLYSWLDHAESVLHATSTVGIQSALTGKTPIALCPVGDMKKTFQYRVSSEAVDLASVLKRQNAFNQSSHLGDIAQYITALNGKTAAQNIVDRLDDLSVSGQLPLKLSVEQYLKLMAYDLVISTAIRAPLIEKTPFTEKHRIAKKYRGKLEGGIKKTQILEAVSSLSRVHSIRPSEIVVRAVAPQAFSVEYMNSGSWSAKRHYQPALVESTG